ncbi:MerR family DNA-binding transcriptional regulator [Roseomonas sp. CCTCC AB2023176]|uniref:MerR family transcriptional regulator n=1 Tax=Roseomonas sp. CCTCC AB2023176 TaxID=3342640 RepID=UPI0035E37D63
MTPALLTINELADELGVTPRAIRFYEAKGLLSPGRQGDREGANRVFTRRDRARLLLILRGKRLGFTLAEIAEYLDLYDSDPTQREQVRLLLAKVEERIGVLEQQRRDLEQALGELQDIRTQARAALAGQDAAAPATVEMTEQSA